MSPRARAAVKNRRRRVRFALWLSDPAAEAEETKFGRPVSGPAKLRLTTSAVTSIRNRSIAITLGRISLHLNAYSSPNRARCDSQHRNATRRRMASSGRQESWSGSNISKLERDGQRTRQPARVLPIRRSRSWRWRRLRPSAAGGGDGSLVERNTD